MKAKFLRGDARGALTEATRAIEACSAAEIVIAVRPRSSHYLHADLATGVVAAIACHVFLLFSPWPFALAWMAIDPLVLGALVGFATSRLPPVRRALTPASSRRAWVQSAAHATFFENGVRLTRERTGVLVYVSLLERAAVVVADQGVRQAVYERDWQRGVTAIEDCVRRGGDGLELAEAITGLAGCLADALPRGADDENELSDEVCA